MKRTQLFVMAGLAALSAGCFIAAACSSCGGEYETGREIPGINANAVLNIDKNKLNFAVGMDGIDAVDIISRCGCTLVDDAGNTADITAQYLRDGTVRYENFDLSSAGVNKQIKISYKNAENYIFYDVSEYKVNLYLDEDMNELWKSAPSSAAMGDDLQLSVWVDLSDYNYSTDSAALSSDGARARRFNGWYDATDGLQTGIQSYSSGTAGGTQTLAYHAHFMTAEELADYDIQYESGYRVFKGYNGGKKEVDIPEGVTLVDLSSLFPSSAAATPVAYDTLNVPSTARMSLPLHTAINTAGLKALTVDGGNAYYSSFGGALYSKDFAKLYLMPAENTGEEFHSGLKEIETYSCAYWQVTELVIPDSVTTLGDFCFAYSALESVEWGLNVTNIGTGVFLGTSVNMESDGKAIYTELPGADGQYMLSMIIDKDIEEYAVMDGTVYVSGDAFSGCSKLVRVDLGDKLRVLGDSAFSGCTALAEINLPASLESMGENVFYDCTSLERVTGLGVNSGTKISNGLFFGCTSLSEITIPDGCTEIGEQAFYGCGGLKNIVLPDTLKNIGAQAFYGCGFESISLPASLVKIGAAAFSHSYLESVDFTVCPLLTELPDSAFAYCNLKSVVLPSHITSIGVQCFYYNMNLTEVDLGSIKVVPERAFAYCYALAEVDFGAAEEIEHSAFGYCRSLTSIVLPDTVTYVGDYAFRNCVALERITLGRNVRTFGIYTLFDDGVSFNTSNLAVWNCTALKRFDVDEYNENFKADSGVLYGKSAGGRDYGDGGVLYCVPAAIESDSLVLPQSVRVVLPYAFQSQKNLTAVTLNEGLENIGKAAFYNFAGLTEIKLPSTVVNIGASIFLNCGNLQTVTIEENNAAYSSDGNLIYENDVLIMFIGGEEAVIKEGTREIAEAVFMNKTRLKRVVIPDSVLKIGNKAFSGCSALESLTIGKGLSVIGAEAFASLSGLKTITVDAANASLKAENNVLYNKDGTKVILCAANNGMTTLDILAGVREIGEYAFSYHATLGKVKIPDTVKIIGNYAFFECRAMSELDLSLSLETVGSYAFSFAYSPLSDDNKETRRCDALKTVTLYENVKSIGAYAFYGHYGIERLYLKTSYQTFMNFLAGNADSLHYLINGCPIEDTGKNYNDVERLLYSEYKPTINHDGFGWYYTEDGKNIKW